MALFTLIMTIAGTLVPAILNNSGVIGAGTAGLIASLAGPVEQLIAGIKSGQSKTSDALAALAAISGVIAVLKAQTNLPAAVLTEIDNVDKDVQAALAGWAKAGEGYNQSLYAPIATV